MSLRVLTATTAHAMTFDFGIVNFNGGALLSECIASIVALDEPPSAIVVFDNASSDRSADEAEQRFPHVKVIRSERNLGYATALNRMLAEMSADVVVLCNMDLRFDRAWSREVADALQRHTEADAIASLVLEMTNPPVVNSAGIRFYPDLHPQNVGSGRPYRPGSFSETETLGGYGAVMCFRRRAIRDLRFDEDYFLFFEETDFFLRFALLGRRTLFVPGAIVYHHRSFTTRRYSPLKLYFGERNRVTTIFKLLPVWYWPLTFAYSLRRFAKLRGKTPRAQDSGSSAFPGSGAIIRTILHAWAAAVLRLPATWSKRSAFWKTTPADPSETLRLLGAYRLPDADLSLR